jgi:hypothetical protein
MFGAGGRSKEDLVTGKFAIIENLVAMHHARPGAIVVNEFSDMQMESEFGKKSMKDPGLSNVKFTDAETKQMRKMMRDNQERHRKEDNARREILGSS